MTKKQIIRTIKFFFKRFKYDKTIVIDGVSMLISKSKRVEIGYISYILVLNKEGDRFESKENPLKKHKTRRAAIKNCKSFLLNN